MTEQRLSLDTSSQIFFYEQDHYYLSNFSAFRVRWRGIDFDTSEHAYHWEKFPGRREIRDEIMLAPSAHAAFKLAEKYREWRRPDWDNVKEDLMRCILIAKVQQHEYVARKLLETGDRILIENSWRDDYWGWGPNRDGKNMLGVLWMQVRTQMRLQCSAEETSALCPHGMPLAENVCGPCSEGQPNRQWLIRKRGYYYRPNRAGYTASIAEAGRYTETEAKAEAAIEPEIMQAIPLSQVQAVCDRAAHLADVPATRCISGYWFCENCQLCNSETIHHTSCPLCGGLRPTANRGESR